MAIRKYGQVDDETFRSRATTVDEKGKRKWIFATKPFGDFYKWRNYLAYFLVAFFLVLPWIYYKGNQLVQFNLIEGRFIIFGKIFWPNDFFIFAVMFITAVIVVVLFTVVYGRIFCGWICPQTIFMEFVFRKIEWWIEGNPAQQKKLAAAPWNREKILKKGAKQLIFFAISFFFANTFLAYIIGSRELVEKIQSPISENWSILSGLLIFTLMFYIVFAYVREIVCTTICPYGRLQGVMYDKDTMQISYDYKRGEPRGKLKDKDAFGLGDCIDCNRCVVVCPTGIDIRNGAQMECVGCTACIDACDDIMDKINLPRGLIRYASENEIQTGKKSPLSTRAKAYTVVLVLLIFVLMGLLISRDNIDMYVGRVKGQTFLVENGMVSNLLDAQIINKSNRDIPIQIRLIDKKGNINVIGNSSGMILKKENSNKITFFVALPENQLKSRTTKIKIGIYEGEKLLKKVSVNFLGPFK